MFFYNPGLADCCPTPLCTFQGRILKVLSALHQCLRILLHFYSYMPCRSPCSCGPKSLIVMLGAASLHSQLHAFKWHILWYNKSFPILSLLCMMQKSWSCLDFHLMSLTSMEVWVKERQQL